MFYAVISAGFAPLYSLEQVIRHKKNPQGFGIIWYKKFLSFFNNIIKKSN